MKELREGNTPLLTWSKKPSKGPEVTFPPEMQTSSVIEALSPQVPETFIQQAKQTAEYIRILDNKEAPNSIKLKKFVTQVNATEFINLLKISRFGRGGDDKSFPEWLHTKKQTNPERKEMESNISSEFEKWVASEGFDSYTNPKFGTFFRINEDHRTTRSPKEFKLYVENEQLLAALSGGTMNRIVDRLKNKRIEPNVLKLYDSSRLVMYYRDIQNAEKVEHVFDEHNVKFRGPAQDVFEVVLNDQGQPIVEFKDLSNDAALGNRNPVKYELTTYHPAHFLQNYLRLCLFAGKDPTEPYKTSFVYITGEQQPTEKQLKDARELTQNPIMYVPNRYTAQPTLMKKLV